MSQRPKDFYEFGPYRIDPEERRLLRDQEPIPLPPKAFETLLILVRHSEQVVLKDDLMKTLWPDTFVEEANLTQNVFVLRKALGESAQDPRYIVTVPGRGYRFASKVATSTPGDLVVETHSIQTVTINEETHPSWYRLAWLAVACFVVVAGGFRLYRAYVSPRTPMTNSTVATPPARRSVAILGFRNLSGRPEEGWLSHRVGRNAEHGVGSGRKTAPRFRRGHCAS
jgi:DNA-binding winged helix-turn-helix (wHTH) protein